MGQSKDESEVNFDSMPCDQFKARTDKAKIALKTLSVSHNSSSWWLKGGIRAKLSDESAAYETPKFKFDPANNYEMNIGEFQPDQIFIQSSGFQKDFFMPYGWKITSKQEEMKDIDVIEGLKKDSKNKKYEHQFAQI